MYEFIYRGQKSDALIDFVENSWKSVQPKPLPSLPQAAPEQRNFGKSIENSFTIFQYFTQQEAAMGILCALVLFMLGFLVGRMTATPVGQQNKMHHE